ncbi:MAG: ATP phosphoribosyltransferase regulatory subunit [Chloroflexi bacterium]|nr:ATP phosphoribosyltransferase regulatory subunit [Chloroflexota bacterium]
MTTPSPFDSFPAKSPPAIPRGVSDFFGGAAVARREAEATLREMARRWGYVEVIPPTFEYAETLATEAGPQLAEELYRFLDRDGRALALRPDLTIPTARLAGSKLYDQPLPQRFFYAGPAFRYEEPRAGRQREFWQAGLELIGVAGPDADAEVLAFAARGLEALALPVIRFSLGHLGYFHGLVEHLGLTSVEIRVLQSALDRKSWDDLQAFADALDASGADREAVLGLLGLNGKQGEGVLARARKLARNQKMAEAVNQLDAVEKRLEHYGVKHFFVVDLADVRGMNYYTGITFKAYTDQMGFSIVNGGRYDNLVGHFGASRPAVGCAFYLDRILLARVRQSGPPPEPMPDILVHPCPCGGYVRLAEEARAAGRVAVIALGPEAPHDAPTTIRCSCEANPPTA